MRSKSLNPPGATVVVKMPMGVVWIADVNPEVLKQLVHDFGKASIKITNWGRYKPGDDEYRDMTDMLVL